MRTYSFESITARIVLIFKESFCRPQKFLINGIPADSSDFGTLSDTEADSVQCAGTSCGNMQFRPSFPPSRAALTKFGISDADYEWIARRLQHELSFGTCNWCNVPSPKQVRMALTNSNPF